MVDQRGHLALSKRQPLKKHEHIWKHVNRRTAKEKRPTSTEVADVVTPLHVAGPPGALAALLGGAHRVRDLQLQRWKFQKKGNNQKSSTHGVTMFSALSWSTSEGIQQQEYWFFVKVRTQLWTCSKNQSQWEPNFKINNHFLSWNWKGSWSLSKWILYDSGKPHMHFLKRFDAMFFDLQTTIDRIQEGRTQSQFSLLYKLNPQFSKLGFEDLYNWRPQSEWTASSNLSPKQKI